MTGRVNLEGKHKRGERGSVEEEEQIINVRVSELFPFSTAATQVAAERIYLDENLTSYRRELLKQTNQKRKEGLLVSAWSIDGKVFTKTSPEGRPLRVYEKKNDLVNI